MQTINKQPAEYVTGDYLNKGVCFCIISQDLVQYAGNFSPLLIIALISWDLVLTKTLSNTYFVLLSVHFLYRSQED